jgi:hypothetical protein
LKVRGVEEKKREEKKHFITLKSLFLFLLSYNYSFASAVERRMAELMLALPERFKSLKMMKR